MRQTLRSGSPLAYAGAVAGLWFDVRGALASLDTLAADLDFLVDAQDALPALQYELHCAAELAAGLVPPDELAAEHAELADALADARESTADIADALGRGGAAAALALLWEWRGALFRVRYAHRRLERPRRPRPVPVAPPAPRRATALTAVAVGVGSVLVLLAALLGLWLLVALTLAGSLAASVLLHP